MKYWTSTVFVFFTLSFWVLGQKKPVLQTETGVFAGSSNQIPFWHQTNQFGTAPVRSPALTGRVRIFSQPIAPVDSLGKRRLFEWNYGVELAGNLASKSNATLVEGYIGVRLGALQLQAGRKRTIIGLLDTLLTTGAVSYSGNALPIPKVEISTNGFVVFPFTKQMLAFHATFAHGWVGRQRISPDYFPRDNGVDYYGHYLNTYFHQKSFYGRFGKPHWKINLYGGFNDLAFWGNEAKIWNPSFQLSKSESYRRVVMGINWEGSKVGNHFGTIDLAAEIKGKKWDLFLYRQSIYDTGSLLNAFNLDALNGLSFRNKTSDHRKLFIQKLLIEYLYTNDQRDPVLDQWVGIGNGYSNYFSHYIYLDGWAYKGRLLGTSFAVIDKNAKENAGNSDFRGGYIINNRIQAVHFGLNGTYNTQSRFTILASFSKNQGTYSEPFEVTRYQFSSSFTVEQTIPRFKNTIGKISLATDLGSLYKNQVGIFASVQKTW